MPFLVPASLLLLQVVLVALAPPAIARPTAYLVMVLAPVLAGVAVLRRGAREATTLRSGWIAVALSLGFWALGAWGNLWQELVLGRTHEMYRTSMLAFNLAAMPIAFVLAGEGRTPSRALARLADALVATGLSYGFFVFTFDTLTTLGTSDQPSVTTMVLLLDALNVYVALGALVRWYAADDATERNLFRALCAYLVVYELIVFANNHFIAPDPESGPEQSSIITLAFAVLAGFALARPSAVQGPRAPDWLVRIVRSVSPIMLVGGLLFISLLLIRLDYVTGTFGVLLAFLGYGVRTTLNQVGFIEVGEKAQRERTELQSIALTDALTGVANRRSLEQSLSEAALRERPSDWLSVLMIDIDYFKLLNDRLGHPAGDGVLREVATALQLALSRPGDVLGRYGGEEFVALLHGTDSPGAAVVAERLRAGVEQLGIEHPESPFGVVTVSIGLASASRDEVLATAGLIEAADKALYEAKHAGRNQIKGLVSVRR
jgi:diguanylate cyclase (GGDEF)-like protein